MLTAQFCFFPDLSDFLPSERRAGTFPYAFEAGQSVKHLIEAAGVPHTEVGLLQVNGVRVGFDYQVQNDDRVQIYPATSADNPLPGEARFVLDNHLGRLAAYLRMFGFDTVYRNDFDDDELAQIAATEGRILVTRDRRLLMRKAVQYGYCPRSMDSQQQILEVLRRFDLFQRVGPFRRCLRCNGPLERVEKAAVLDQLEPLTRLYYEEFHRCPTCGQIYWKGSHYERMLTLIERIQKGHAAS